MSDLEKAREDIKKNIKKGSTCPCCYQDARQYRRKLNSGMVSVLTQLYKLKLAGSDWININTSNIAVGRDYSYLRYWGLIEEKENDSFAKKNSGFWKITAKGIAFLKDEILVPSHIILYNKTLIEFSGKLVNVQKCMREFFNLEELMRS